MSGAAAGDDAWNHNAHYYPLVLAAVPGATFRRRLPWRYTLVWEKP